MAAGADKSRVCVGAIAGAFGVRGQVRLRSFTEDPLALGDYGPVFTEDGSRCFELELERTDKPGFVIGRLGEDLTREQIEALKSTRLYVDRDVLPALMDEDEFYHSDLVGLFADLEDGSPFGKVVGVQDFGAGDLLEIRLNGTKKTVFVPFTRAAVPAVDVPGGKVLINPPEGLLDDE